MSETKRVWNAEGNRLYLSHPSTEFETLENAIYSVGIDQFDRFFLTKVNDKFEFPYKIYGLERDLINRVVKTYNTTKGINLGVLLNGLKGTGAKYTKTRLPVVLVAVSEASNRSEASKEEYRIKQLTRKEKLQLININNKQ